MSEELNIESIKKALSFVIEPDLKKDIISLGLVSNIQINPENKTVEFTLQVNNPAMHNKKRMEDACAHQINRFHPEVKVLTHIEALPKSNERSSELRTILPGVKNVIAISSGKGGVGKSTIAANLAAGMAKKGYKVGLLDADIYGPSVPLMFDVENEKPSVVEEEGKTWMVPVESYGVKVLSIGFFAQINQAVVWRGPMASKALQQMFKDVKWGKLDYFFIDLPPGTGDIHLTLVQSAPLSGAIVVSTPQQVALSDARKGVDMFRQPAINVPVLGIVENMAWFTPEELPDNKYYIFGKDGAQRLAEDIEVDLLGKIPLYQSIRQSGDVGRPAVLQDNTPQSLALMDLVNNVEEKTNELVANG